MFSMSLYLLYLIRYSSIFLSSYSEKNTSSVVLSKKQYLNLTYAIFDDKDNSAIFFNKNVKFSKFIRPHFQTYRGLQPPFPCLPLFSTSAFWSLGQFQ